MTLGSLFDGSGGFPLAGTLAGIEPVWSSEIEQYPLRVTAARFPNVKQLGDVTMINGAEIEPVDIITFGSPCQDLSVAEKPPRRYIVRRLTPLECCRMQGFPDWWTDGVEGSDSAQYKMWGNGIALPCAVDVMRRIAKEMEGKLEGK